MCVLCCLMGVLMGRSRGGSRVDMAASIERCPHPQMGPSRHPDIEAFITSMCTQVRLTSNCFPADNTPR
jgi:hypothetical protein